MFCPNCGKKAQEGALFCGNCGSRLPVPSAVDDSQALQPAEAADGQGEECPHLDVIAALRRIFAKRGTSRKCVCPLSPKVLGNAPESTLKFHALKPEEKPLALFGTEKKGDFRGVLVTDTSVRWRIVAVDSDSKWCEGQIEHSKIKSIGFVTVDGEEDDDENDGGGCLLAVNDAPVGVFATDRGIVHGARKTDADARAAVIEFCELVTERPPEVKLCPHSVEWMFNGKLGDELPTPRFSYAVVGLCALMYIVQWIMGAFDSDTKLVRVAESLGGDVPLFGYLVCGFMHGGFIHLAANLTGLATFCVSVEKIFGTRLYAVTYLASVLGGGVCAAAMHPGVTSVGASGGLFGVMGAIWVFGGIRFFAMKKHVSIIDRRRVYRWVKGYGALLLGNIYFTMKFAKIANISVGGHLGGLLAGAVFGLVALMVVPPRREF